MADANPGGQLTIGVSIVWVAIGIASTVLGNIAYDKWKAKRSKK